MLNRVSIVMVWLCVSFWLRLLMLMLCMFWLLNFRIVRKCLCVFGDSVFSGECLIGVLCR